MARTKNNNKLKIEVSNSVLQNTTEKRGVGSTEKYCSIAFMKSLNKFFLAVFEILLCDDFFFGDFIFAFIARMFSKNRLNNSRSKLEG